jgi:hypothetical protein
MSATLCIIVFVGTALAQHGPKVDTHRLAVKAHPTDPVLQAEHQELLDLLNPDDSTCTAIRDGVWSNPMVWKDGSVPGADARVLIAEGTTVTLADTSGPALRWLRIDGTLQFASDTNTRLRVDTMVVSPTGHLIIGTAEKPIAQGKKAEIIFAGQGPIDTKWDPHQLSRGLVSHGGVTIHGATVAPYVKLARHPHAGDTKLILSETPTNWKRGDRLVLTGTRIPGPPRAMKTMNKGNSPGEEIPYDKQQSANPTKPTKKGAKSMPPSAVYVKNPKNILATPNETVRSQSEDEELVIEDMNGGEVTVRPLTYDHIPLAADGLSVYLANVTRNVVFRSEKAEPIPERGHVMFMHSPRVRIANAGFYDLGRTNKLEPIDDPEIRGKSGAEPGTGSNPRGRYAVHFHRTGSDIHSEPIRVRGCVVVNNPGWGFVSHSSHVEFDDNVAFNVDGSAFVTEAGDEVGAFRRNLAVRSIGSGEDPNSRDNLNDYGHEGNGFWFQGGGLIVEDNIAAGSTFAAFFYFTRGLVQGDLGGRMMFAAANLQDASWAKGYQFVNVGDVPIRSFKGNVAFASHMGYAIRYQLVGNTKFGGPRNPGRSVLEDGVVWNTNYGVRIQYSERITLRNLRLFGNVKSSVIGVYGANEGLVGIRYENLHVEGWETGINVHQSSDHLIEGGYYNNVVNIKVPMPLGHGRDVDIKGDIRFGTLSDKVLGNRRQYDIYLDGSYPELLHAEFRGRNPNILFIPILTRIDTVSYRGQQLYFPEQAADYVPLPEDASGRVPEELIGKTNKELWEHYGLAFAGTLPPADAHEEPRIHGLVGSPATYRRELEPNLYSSNKLRDCRLALIDDHKQIVAAATVNLRPGWNLVTLSVDQAPRSVLVYGGEAKRYIKKPAYAAREDKRVKEVYGAENGKPKPVRKQ